MHFDVVFQGGNINSLVCATLAAELGFKTCILEKSRPFRGFNSSFALGDESFDFGYHALDYGRSVLATKVVEQALDGEFIIAELARAIFLKGHLIAYNESLANYPEVLRNLFPADLVNDIDSENPTRADIARVYGPEFSKWAFEEAIPSYRLLAEELALGVDEKYLIKNIFPWFFPRAKRVAERASEHFRFHDAKRGGEMLNLEKKAEKAGVSILTQYDLEFAGKNIQSLKINGETCSFQHFFWTASVPELETKINAQLVESKPATMMMGSFVYDSDVLCDYHEILVAAPELHIDRVSFPGKMAGKRNNLVQVEFSFPTGKIDHPENEWHRLWQNDLAKMGVIREGAEAKFSKVHKIPYQFGDQRDIPSYGKKMKERFRQLQTNFYLTGHDSPNASISRVLPTTLREFIEIVSA